MFIMFFKKLLLFGMEHLFNILHERLDEQRIKPTTIGRLDRSTNQLHMHSVCVNVTNEDLITLCHLRGVCLLPLRGRFLLWAISILIYNIVP